MADVGRPKWIPGKKEMDKAHKLASVGLTNQNIAASLGISEATIYEKFKEYPEFLEAVENGRAEGVSKIATRLVEDAEKGNTTAQIFFLKARGGWKDRHHVEVTGADGGPVEIKRLPDEKLLAAVDRVLAKGEAKE